MALINPYANVYELFSEFGLLYRDAKSWRLTEVTPGEILGLPDTHGNLLATNGILCLILLNKPKNGYKVFEGHLEWFIAVKIDGRTLRSMVETETVAVEISAKAKKVYNSEKAKELAAELLKL